jgi:hypothetical protein
MEPPSRTDGVSASRNSQGVGAADSLAVLPVFQGENLVVQPAPN